MGKTIAMDGPSGSGKSTLAKLLAEKLGFSYLDTGALYRAVAMGLVRKGVEAGDTDSAIASALKDIIVEFRGGQVFLGKEDVSVAIRTPEMGHFASVFSARKPVRDFLLPVQKRAAEHNDLVAEGRDMCTVVFPDAWKKFYIDASQDARARRRFDQLREAGQDITMEQALEDVRARDERDSSRDIAPLRVAEGAVYIDTSQLGIEQVMERILVATGRQKGA
jgi:cytidylate kinase